MPRVPDELFRAPKGVHDVLPPASGAWVDLVAAFADRAARFGYGLAITPMFEHIEVFERVGEGTDVVAKEMYELTDKGGRRLALRPEGTASVVRAFVEHRPTTPWKVWYLAPNFRYERAQKGRYRQHWQLGAEVLGAEDPAVDVEVISLLDGFYRAIGLDRVSLLLNSMGDAASRREYVAVLRQHLLAHADALGPEFRERVEANPLRVLDSKVEEWADVIERSPQLPEHLSDAARVHFEQVQEGLQALGIDFELAPRLVRGFDYYTRTAFEFQSAALDAAQNALGGGGRYDGLAEEMGGPPTPGIGFGTGIERVLIAREAAGVARETHALDAFVIDGLQDAGGVTASVVTAELRAAGLGADRAYGGRSLKAQMKAADRSGARFAVVLGKAEMAAGAVGVRDLESGEQVDVPRAEVVAWLQQRREQRDKGT
ncbi:MAG TPA: histidine--tRNA ligase [Acidimicrobiia bacterium]